MAGEPRHDDSPERSVGKTVAAAIEAMAIGRLS
jgi:hypothetical protein